MQLKKQKNKEINDSTKYELFIGRNIWSDSLVVNVHYSHSLPSSIYLVVGVRDKENKSKVYAACYFSSSGAGRWTTKFLELSRLVKLNGFEYPLTKLISFGVNAIKKKREYGLIISYADFTRNHHGGIYQAASWNYHGKRGERSTGFKIDGKFVHRRTMFSRYGTSSRSIIKDLKEKGHVIDEFCDKGKFLYWKPVNKKGIEIADQMKLQKNTYPKPKADININVIEYMDESKKCKGYLF